MEGGHGHGKSPTSSICVEGKQELLELREFLPFGPETYKVGYGRTGQFIWTPKPVADQEFDFEIEAVK
jgi:hypothetical protein